MGLFSDLFGSSSHSQTTTSTSQVTNTQLTGGANQAPINYGSGKQTVIVTNNTVDGGAIKMATDIGHAALELGAQESANGSAVAIAGLNHASDAYTSSLALVGDVTTGALNGAYGLAAGVVDSNTMFAGKALDSVNRFSTDALDSNTYIAGKSLDSAASAYSQAIGAIAQQSNNAISSVQGIAAQVSQSSQQTTDTTIQKIVMVIAVAAALVFVAPYAFGKK